MNHLRRNTVTLYERLEAELDHLEKIGMMRNLSPVMHQNGRLRINGRSLINLASNDYLSLGEDNALHEEFLKRVQVDSRAFGSGSSRLLSGNYSVMEELEAAIAADYGKEAALTFNSGYHMNIGILPALTSPETLIVADRLVHASVIDGILLSKAPFLRFRHNDLFGLARILEVETPRYETVIVVVESIYSMDGDIADLPALVALKRRYENVQLYVDEAHAVGCLGNRGLGLSEETDTIADIDYLCGTFGKALASAGGYLVCREVVRRYLINRCRSFIFSTALPPMIYAYTLCVWRMLPELGLRRRKLSEKAQILRDVLDANEIKTPSSSHIIPVIVGENKCAIDLSICLADAGYYAPPIRVPTVPSGTARVRLSVTANLPIEDLQSFLLGNVKTI